MRNLSIRMKVVVWCGLTMLVAMACGFGFSGYRIWEETKAGAEQEAMKIAAAAANKMKGDMDGKVKAVETYVATLSDAELTTPISGKHGAELTLRVCKANPSVFGAWSWINVKAVDLAGLEFDEEINKDKIFSISGTRDKGQSKVITRVNRTVAASDAWFHDAVTNNRTNFSEPYFWDYGDGVNRFVSSLATPFHHNGKIIGVGGMDISMDQMQVVADGCDDFDGQAALIMLSPSGTIMGYKNNPDRIGKDLSEFSDIYKEVKDRVLGGEALSAWAKTGDLVLYYPFEIGQTGQYIVSCMRISESVIVAPAKAALIKIVGIGIICLIGAGFLMWFVAGKISNPISEVVDNLNEISQGEGDLTVRLNATSKDELGDLANAFNQFVEKVHDTIADVMRLTLDVASASTQIAASSEEIAAGMEEQAGQVQEISTAVEEMSSSITEVAQKSHEANSSAGESKSVALEGGEIVGQTMSGMNEIETVVRDSSSAIGELGKQGERIGEIIEVINDIADQTNLLALNAAIEAARAGEHGRGFAVVADEVRKLADRTTKATDGVSELISGIQSGTHAAVEKMGSGTEIVSHGVSSAQQAGESLNNIVGSAENVAEMVQSIAAASEEQSAAAEQISKNIQSIAAVTHQSKEGTQQASVAAAGLSEKAESLKQLVGQFKVSDAA
ncbi:methyl-accepting chemotaxis protein [Planctomycetota bacterium]|nr:methyl-accepting chemotaxis protein [Planctomycetota bacterium]